MNPDRDPNHALSICAGTDNFLKIGEPQGAGMRQNLSIEEIWQEQCGQVFGKCQPETDVAQGIPNPQKFREEKVDKMRMQKDQELEDYKKDIERAKKFEKSKLLQQ